ncbi:MAG TPA: rod shape-determining protein MreD [Coriobacteriia bacterium]|nr:rod shape-determining protein MreD [Coriobacteriia bacterium]
MMNNTMPQATPVFTIVGSLISVLLQLMLAPSIAVFEVAPNFLLCFAVVNAMFTGVIRATSVGFILGLVYDLIAQGALGAMALVLTIVAYAISSLNKEAISISWTIQALFLLLSAFAGEILYAAELAVIGYDDNFWLSFGMRVIPTTIYCGLIGLIIFLIMNRLNKNKRPEILRSKFK